MPQTKKSVGAPLQIDIAAPVSWAFAPGDTIIGTVVRRSPIVTSDATVSLVLFGRVKTKISVRKYNGQNYRTVVYRGRWPLIGSETRQVLHHGPLHLAGSKNGSGASGSDSLSWNFSVTIPTHPHRSLANIKDESFVPLNNIEDHTLPGSFFSYNDEWGPDSFHCFVEYYLESTIKYHFGSDHSQQATHPITVRNYSWTTASPTPRFLLSTKRETVQTQRLLPGMEHANLTFKQKTQKFFHSSKVPTLGYTAQVSTPSFIQLESPSPIPLVIRVSENPETTSPEIHDTLQRIQLISAKMILQSHVTVLARDDGFLAINHTHSDAYSKDQSLGLEVLFRNRENNPVIFEFTGKSPGPQDIDIGNWFQLVLCPDGLYARNRHLTYPSEITPDFVTYSIKLEHSIKLKLEFTVAHETQTMEMTRKVEILPTIQVNPSLPAYSQN